MFTPNDYLVVLGWVCIMYGSRFGPVTRPEKFYEKNRVWLSPPGWVFGIAWTTLYAMVAVAGIMFYLTRPDTMWQYHVGSIVLIVNVLMQKVWLPLFFSLRWYLVALIDCAGALGTAVAFAIMAAWIAFENEEPHAWVAFGMFVPYTLWLGFATFLSFEYVAGWYVPDDHERRRHRHSKV